MSTYGISVTLEADYTQAVERTRNALVSRDSAFSPKSTWPQR